MDLSMVPSASQQVKAAPKVVGVHPTGSLVLVELLTAQELTSGRIFVGDETEISGPPQAYVMEVGASLPEAAGIRVGQRVLVQGKGVGPLPNFDGNRRERMLVEFSMIKGVLDEDSVPVAQAACCRSGK